MDSSLLPKKIILSPAKPSPMGTRGAEDVESQPGLLRRLLLQAAGERRTRSSNTTRHQHRQRGNGAESNTTTPTQSKDCARQRARPISAEIEDYISSQYDRDMGTRTIRAAQTSLMRSEAPTLSLTVLAAARQQPKGCTYFACSSPDWYQKKTSRIRDRKSTIHNRHAQARSINSRAFRRKDVHVQAAIHSLPSPWSEARTHHRHGQHGTHRGIPTLLRHPWAFHP